MPEKRKGLIAFLDTIRGGEASSEHKGWVKKKEKSATASDSTMPTCNREQKTSTDKAVYTDRSRPEVPPPQGSFDRDDAYGNKKHAAAGSANADFSGRRGDWCPSSRSGSSSQKTPKSGAAYEDRSRPEVPPPHDPHGGKKLAAAETDYASGQRRQPEDETQFGDQDPLSIYYGSNTSGLGRGRGQSQDGGLMSRSSPYADTADRRRPQPSASNSQRGGRGASSQQPSSKCESDSDTESESESDTAVGSSMPSRAPSSRGSRSNPRGSARGTPRGSTRGNPRGNSRGGSRGGSSQASGSSGSGSSDASSSEESSEDSSEESSGSGSSESVSTVAPRGRGAPRFRAPRGRGAPRGRRGR